MKDQLGLYYHPDPQDLDTRVYVRTGPAGPEFRLWRKEMPQVWERHGWLAYTVIEAAASMYRAGQVGASQAELKANPLLLYDLNVAAALLRQEELERGRS